MKKIFLLLLVISLQSCISLRFDSTDQTNKVYKNVANPNISANGTFLDFVVKDDQWSNENTHNSTRAKFKNSIGNSTIKLNVKKSIHVEFYHQINLQGELKFEIINARDEVIYSRELTNSVSENFELNFKPGEYMVKWTAENASGSYYLEWKENN